MLVVALGATLLACVPILSDQNARALRQYVRTSAPYSSQMKTLNIQHTDNATRITVVLNIPKCASLWTSQYDGDEAAVEVFDAYQRIAKAPPGALLQVRIVAAGAPAGSRPCGGCANYDPGD